MNLALKSGDASQLNKLNQQVKRCWKSLTVVLWCPQADLINQLYQGKLKDYVRCLECGYESWRIDTYLDIPLVIRPFGASQAYGSVVRVSSHVVLRCFFTNLCLAAVVL